MSSTSTSGSPRGAQLRAGAHRALPFAGHLDWRIVEGHGAYICDEETALIESIEGRRGMPGRRPTPPSRGCGASHPDEQRRDARLRPRHPPAGGQRFRDLGRTEPGTKLYCIGGHVAVPGIYELPLGVCLDGWWRPRGLRRRAGLLARARPELPAHGHQGLPGLPRPAQGGLHAGSAGVVVLGDTVDPEAAMWQSVFFEDESCGQCALPAGHAVRAAGRRSLPRLGEPHAPRSPGRRRLGDGGGQHLRAGHGGRAARQTARQHFPDHFAERRAEGIGRANRRGAPADRFPGDRRGRAWGWCDAEVVASGARPLISPRLSYPRVMLTPEPGSLEAALSGWASQLVAARQEAADLPANTDKRPR